MVLVWCVVFLRPGYSDNNIVWFVQTHTHIVRTHIYRHLLYPHLNFHFDSISLCCCSPHVPTVPPIFTNTFHHLFIPVLRYTTPFNPSPTQPQISTPSSTWLFGCPDTGVVESAHPSATPLHISVVGPRFTPSIPVSTPTTTTPPIPTPTTTPTKPTPPILHRPSPTPSVH